MNCGSCASAGFCSGCSGMGEIGGLWSSLKKAATFAVAPVMAIPGTRQALEIGGREVVGRALGPTAGAIVSGKIETGVDALERAWAGLGGHSAPGGVEGGPVSAPVPARRLKVPPRGPGRRLKVAPGGRRPAQRTALLDEAAKGTPGWVLPTAIGGGVVVVGGIVALVLSRKGKRR